MTRYADTDGGASLIRFLSLPHARRGSPELFLSAAVVAFDFTCGAYGPSLLSRPLPPRLILPTDPKSSAYPPQSTLRLVRSQSVRVLNNRTWQPLADFRSSEPPGPSAFVYREEEDVAR